MTALQNLKAARDLISVPEKWTQGVFARDKAGNRLWSGDKKAVCFCALGAIDRANVPPAVVNLIVDKLPANCTIGGFNDTHTHAEVIALFDAAIAELEAVAQ